MDQHHHQLHLTLLILPQNLFKMVYQDYKKIFLEIEFYKLHVKTVQWDVPLVKVILHANHVVQDIVYQDLHAMLISQENYKSLI